MISIIIPTYNEEEIIEGCLQLLSQQTVPREQYEIIIVDGGSEDRTVEMAEQCADKIITQESEGVGGARNDGVAIAKYDLIATTDADVVMSTDWLERIIGHFQDPDVVGVCGPNLPLEDERKARIAYFFINIVHWLSVILKVTGMPGNNTAFRKQPFLEIGGYSDVSYLDDMEMGFRLRHMGTIKFDPKLAVKVSIRRMEEEGYWHIMLLWLKGDINLLRGRDLKPIKYFRKQTE